MQKNDNLIARKKKRHELWSAKEWPVVGLLALIVAGLGFAGFHFYYTEEGIRKSLWDIAYYTLQLFVMESGATTEWVPWPLQLARFVAPLIAGYAAVRAFMLVFREQLQGFNLRRLKDHVIVVGLGRKGVLFAQGFQKLGYPVVVVDLNERDESLDQFRDAGMIPVEADATDKNVLKSVHLDRAKYLISVCGQDEVNAEVAVHARDLSSGRTIPLKCVIHVVEPQLCQLLRRQEMTSRENNFFKLEFVNLFENAIQALWMKYRVFDEAEIRAGISPHFIIIGLGRMGETLILHLSRHWKRMGMNQLLEISVVDRSADQKKASLLLRYPYVAKSCNLTPYTLDVNSAEFIQAPFLSGPKKIQSASIYICLDNDSLAVSLALMLRQKFDETPIYIRVSHETGLATLLKSDRSDLLRPFGSLEQTCTPEMLVSLSDENLARAAHMAYYEKRLREGYQSEDARAVVPWEILPEDLKEQNRKQVEDIVNKLKAIHCDVSTLIDREDFEFTPEELEMLARMEHDRWCREKREQGWKHGPVKNAETKETPYLVDYDKLSEEIKDYDRNAVREIPHLLADIGFQIYRLK